MMKAIYYNPAVDGSRDFDSFEEAVKFLSALYDNGVAMPLSIVDNNKILHPVSHTTTVFSQEELTETSTRRCNLLGIEYYQIGDPFLLIKNSGVTV